MGRNDELRSIEIYGHVAKRLSARAVKRLPSTRVRIFKGGSKPGKGAPGCGRVRHRWRLARAGQREARRAGLWSGEARADMAIHSLYADAESDSDDDALLGVVFGHSARATASLDAHAGFHAREACGDGTRAAPPDIPTSDGAPSTTTTTAARVSAWSGPAVIRAPLDSSDEDRSDDAWSSDDDRDDILGSHRGSSPRERAAAAAAEMETLGLRTPLANDPPARGGTPVSTAARAGASPRPSPSPVGADGLRAVSRARAVSHQRVAARRAAARAAADRRKEALELELHWALQAEAEEKAAVADAAAAIDRDRAARDAEEAADAAREEQRELEEMEARWRKRRADLDAVLAAGAAEEERRRLAAEAAEKAAAEAAAAKKRAAEAAAKAAEEKAKAEAEEKKKEEAAAAEKAKTEAAEAAAKAAAEAAAARGRPAGPLSSSAGKSGGAVPRVQTSAEASKAEGEFAEALREARARITDYVAAPAAKKERRQINNHITVHVQQIAATRKQIEQKAADVAQFLHSLPNDPQRTYALVSLAKRILTQCDSQVSKLNRFAFALAEVAVRVAAFDRRFGVLLVALLHESCVLAVPKYYPFVEGRYASDEEYFKLMGYVKAEEQGDAPPETPKLENTDTFCLRLRGFMLFYASYAQADHARHPHGLPAAWAWLSRLLNKVPPNRFSATALEAFLKHAGFAMHAAYGRQFGKLLDVVDREFLPSLEAKDDADARPVVSRTRTYLNERGFLNPPEGREMPVTDTSSTTRLSA